jgi:hypothetical protein
LAVHDRLLHCNSHYQKFIGKIGGALELRCRHPVPSDDLSSSPEPGHLLHARVRSHSSHDVNTVLAPDAMNRHEQFPREVFSRMQNLAPLSLQSERSPWYDDNMSAAQTSYPEMANQTRYASYREHRPRQPAPLSFSDLVRPNHQTYQSSLHAGTNNQAWQNNSGALTLGRAMGPVHYRQPIPEVNQYFFCLGAFAVVTFSWMKTLMLCLYRNGHLNRAIQVLSTSSRVTYMATGSCRSQDRRSCHRISSRQRS